MERNRLEEAEKAVRKALEIAPDSSTALSTLGQIKFRQQQYDAAYEALSRAAALDPKNAEVQNFLGITLSQKGLRGPAENALRRAIQLQPGYGSAHNNLAVVYLHQQPPLIELARWHYQKALASGHPRSPQIEQLLESRKAAR
jgi:Flp pilus assembly protein TadD